MKVVGKIILGILLFVIVLGSLFFDCIWNEQLMTYNVKNGAGMDGVTDYARTASVIIQEKPDVVAIQELDSVTGRSKGAYVLDELAKLTGMHATYAPAIDYDGGKYGIGILSKKQPLHVYRYALPGREEARTLLVVEFKQYVYACMHLSLTEEDRIASLSIIREATSGFDKPVFIAGDWNDTPNSPFIQELQKDFRILSTTEKPTCPADEPKECIDYIAVKKDCKPMFYSFSSNIVSAAVESDHRPVTVSLKHWIW